MSELRRGEKFKNSNEMEKRKIACSDWNLCTTLIWQHVASKLEEASFPTGCKILAPLCLAPVFILYFSVFSFRKLMGYCLWLRYHRKGNFSPRFLVECFNNSDRCVLLLGRFLIMIILFNMHKNYSSFRFKIKIRKEDLLEEKFKFQFRGLRTEDV